MQLSYNVKSQSITVLLQKQGFHFSFNQKRGIPSTLGDLMTKENLSRFAFLYLPCALLYAPSVSIFFCKFNSEIKCY